MNAVLTMPDAQPDSSGFTSPIAASSSGLKAMPSPIASVAGITSMRTFPSTGTRAKRSSPSAINPSPTPSGFLIPKRMTNLSE